MSFQIYVTLETNLLLYMLIRKLNLCFRANPLVPIIDILYKTCTDFYSHFHPFNIVSFLRFQGAWGSIYLH